MPKVKRSAKKQIEPARAWAAICDDDPSVMCHVSWYRDRLEQQGFRLIRVRVVPEGQYRRLLAAARTTKRKDK